MSRGNHKLHPFERALTREALKRCGEMAIEPEFDSSDIKAGRKRERELIAEAERQGNGTVNRDSPEALEEARDAE